MARARNRRNGSPPWRTIRLMIPARSFKKRNLSRIASMCGPSDAPAQRVAKESPSVERPVSCLLTGVAIPAGQSNVGVERGMRPSREMVYSNRGYSMFSIRIPRWLAPAILCLGAALLVGYGALEGANWKLVLANGTIIECDGPPMIAGDTYFYRTANGKDGQIDSAEVDREKTDRANHVDSKQQWRSVAAPQPSPVGSPAAATPTPTETPSPTATPTPSNESTQRRQVPRVQPSGASRGGYRRGMPW